MEKWKEATGKTMNDFMLLILSTLLMTSANSLKSITAEITITFPCGH